MRARSERGEGGLANFIWFLVLAAVVYASWNLVPVYFANYALKDKMTEICRTPRPATDDKVLDMLMKYVNEEGLNVYIGRQNFTIQTMDTSRRLGCMYEREVQVLPGWKRTIRFSNDIDQPLVW